MIAQILHTNQYDSSGLQQTLQTTDIFSGIEKRNTFDPGSTGETEWWILFPTHDEDHKSHCEEVVTGSIKFNGLLLMLVRNDQLSVIAPYLINAHIDYLLDPLDQALINHRLKIHENALEQSRLAKKLLADQESILSTLNHDVRNALTTINGMSDVIVEDGAEDEEELEYMVQAIKRSGHQLLHLIQNIYEKYSEP